MTICRSEFHEAVRKKYASLTLSLNHTMTTFYSHFPEPNFKRVFILIIFLIRQCCLILILRKKKVPSKSPSLAFAASSEDDILSWHKAQSSSAAFLKPGLTVRDQKVLKFLFFQFAHRIYTLGLLGLDYNSIYMCRLLAFSLLWHSQGFKSLLYSSLEWQQKWKMLLLQDIQSSYFLQFSCILYFITQFLTYNLLFCKGSKNNHRFPRWITHIKSHISKRSFIPEVPDFYSFCLRLARPFFFGHSSSIRNYSNQVLLTNIFPSDNSLQLQFLYYSYLNIQELFVPLFSNSVQPHFFLSTKKTSLFSHHDILPP